MSIEEKKFKRLRKKLQFLQSELDYVLEVLKEWHLEFEIYYREYCNKKNIDINKLTKEHNTKIDQIIPKRKQKDNGLVIYKDKKDKHVFNKIYKQIARKLHPDVGGDEEEFKKATAAMQEKNFEKLLDICDEHVILIQIDNEMTKVLEDQISDTEKKIKGEKSTYSWKLFSCSNNTCKDKVIVSFLKHLFDYDVK